MTDKKTKFNIIDALILLLLIGVIAAVVYATVSRRAEQNDYESVKLRYVVEVASLSDEFADNAAAGDKVYDYDTGEPIGVIAAVGEAPAYHLGTDADGKQTYTEIEGKSKLSVTIEHEFRFSDKKYYSGDFNLSVGREIALQTPNLFCRGICIDLEKID